MNNMEPLTCGRWWRCSSVLQWTSFISQCLYNTATTHKYNRYCDSSHAGPAHPADPVHSLPALGRKWSDITLMSWKQEQQANIRIIGVGYASLHRLETKDHFIESESVLTGCECYPAEETSSLWSQYLQRVRAAERDHILTLMWCVQVPVGGSERMKVFPALVPQEFRLEGRSYLEAAADVKLSSAGKNNSPHKQPVSH